MQFQFLKRFLIVLAIAIASGSLGSGLCILWNYKEGYRSGYPYGKAELLEELIREIRVDVENKELESKDYKIFYRYKDQDYFILSENGKIFLTKYKQ